MQCRGSKHLSYCWAMAALPSQTRSIHCRSPLCQESGTLVKPDPNEAKVTGMFQDEWEHSQKMWANWLTYKPFIP